MHKHLLPKLLAVAGAACFSAVAADTEDITDQALIKTYKSATIKLSPDLIRLAARFNDRTKDSTWKSGTAESAGSGPIQPAPLPVRPDGTIVIDAVAQESAQALLADLQTLGLENGAVNGRMVSGRLPVSQIDVLNTVSGLRFAQPALSTSNVGLVTTRGDIAQRSDVARSVYGLSGAGVTVGTLSDSYDCLGGAGADVASNDLPAGVQVLDDSACPGTDEGRGMMQFIHDVAPGSEQAFHTAFGGQADFANGILELQSIAGANVIVDDVIYFAEPMFQDGVIAQASTAVANNGSAYFSSAGNSDVNSYESAFRSSGVPGAFGGDRHDFDPGPGVDDLQAFVLGSGTTFFSFQWDEPAFSVSGAPGSASDLDIVLYLSGGVFIGLGGFAANIGGDPIEVFGVSNSGPPLVVDMGIELFAGPAPSLIKYVHFGSNVRFGQGVVDFPTDSATSYGHSNADNMAGVGAAAWFNTAFFNAGCVPACLNGFSARGGVPILFDTAGNSVFELRGRPNFVGPDGGNTTFFGNDLTFSVPGTTEPDGFPNFFGTSASAPHAAGVAALLLETDSGLSASGVYGLLENTALDMDAPGFDSDTGFGFIDAEAAVDLAGTDPDKPHKRLVCHTNGKTLSVGAPAVAAHLAHGDKFGPCD